MLVSICINGAFYFYLTVLQIQIVKNRLQPIKYAVTGLYTPFHTGHLKKLSYSSDKLEECVSSIERETNSLVRQTKTDTKHQRNHPDLLTYIFLKSLNLH